MFRKNLDFGLKVCRIESMIEFVQTDGGRHAAGFKGETGDCVTRAIAIATGKPYRDVYDDLWALDKLAAEIHAGDANKARGPRNGIHRQVYEAYLKSLGWEWVPTMRIGQGCTVHMRSNELPSGRIIVRLSKHLAAVIDGCLYDNHDCSRDGTRCVYGYFKETPNDDVSRILH